MSTPSKELKAEVATPSPSENVTLLSANKRASMPMDHHEGMIALAPFSGLPLRLDLKLPVTNFRVSDLAALSPGQLFMTSWSIADDLPMYVGDEKIVWTEFAVSDEKLMMRVTRIA